MKTNLVVSLLLLMGMHFMGRASQCGSKWSTVPENHCRLLPEQKEQSQC